MSRRLTKYVMGVAQLADQLDREIRLAETRRRVDLDGLLVQEVLGDLRLGPLSSIRVLPLPPRAARVALDAMERAGWVTCEAYRCGHRIKHAWSLVEGAEIPDPPEPVADTAPPRIADLEPGCTAPRRTAPKGQPPFDFPHKLNLREVLR